MIRRALVAGAAVAALAGCSGANSGVGTPSAASESNTAPTSTAAPTTPTAAPTTATPTAQPTVRPTPAFPVAADGNNLKACSDARCEVFVRTGTRIPVDRRVAGFSRLVVSSVGPDGVDYGGSTANASVSAGGQVPGLTFRLNDLNVTTVALKGGRAILRLRPAS